MQPPFPANQNQFPPAIGIEDYAELWEYLHIFIFYNS